MKRNDQVSGKRNSMADLRDQGEKRLVGQPAKSIDALNEVDVRALVHELQVHQIELEMQNEELVQAQLVADEASRRYADLFDFAPTAYFLWDQRGTIHELNFAGASLLRLERSAAIGLRFGQFVCLRNRAAFTNFCRHAIDAELKQTCNVGLLLGEEVLIEGLAAHPAHGSGPSFSGDNSASARLCRATVIDLSERRAAEETLRESEARHRLLVDHSSDLISRFALNGQWLYLSPSCHALLGYAAQELVGQYPFTYIHRDDHGRCQLFFAEMIRTGQLQTATFRMRRADGRYIWFETHGRVVKERAAEPEMVCTARDVTQRLEASRKLRQREAELAQSERLNTMGQMTAELAHELNQPLCAIANFADASLHRMKNGAIAGAEEADVRVWVSHISQQAHRAGNVIKRLMQFVRTGELERQRLCLNDLIRGVEVLLEFGVRSKGTHVEYQLAPQLPPVLADRLLIEQVVLNLVRNAAEAMEETPSEQRRLIVRTFHEASYVGVAIQDSGRGLPPETSHLLFEPYFTTKPAGSGLGLVISRNTTTAHEGRIWGENNPDCGATFQFLLPVAPVFSLGPNQVRHVA
ncbi:Sensor protein FixL [Anatilimnocola aggregata]|uniref:histidine kinase n=1 Tax=Anatilimnocola aggregata TaxID=2528021 RepID=A0A517Y7Z9_9BACT|nr:PAS domain S-box protein [Anatilimnocola aggregata]QDU26369.1 Sensor protein FixL [Anatilimnocola aggregata]